MELTSTCLPKYSTILYIIILLFKLVANPQTWLCVLYIELTIRCFYYNHTARYIAPVYCKRKRMLQCGSSVTWIWCFGEFSELCKSLLHGMIIMYQSHHAFFWWYINLQDGHGDSALIIACHHGHSDVARILLNQGALVNHENQVTFMKCFK